MDKLSQSINKGQHQGGLDSSSKVGVESRPDIPSSRGGSSSL